MSLSIPGYVDGNALTRGRFPGGDTAPATPRLRVRRRCMAGGAAIRPLSAQMTWVSINKTTTTSGTPSNQRMIGIVTLQPLYIRQHRLPRDNAGLVTKFRSDEAISAHVPGCPASGPAFVIAICRISFGLLHAAPRRIRRWSNAAAVPFDADALVPDRWRFSCNLKTRTRRWIRGDGPVRNFSNRRNERRARDLFRRSDPIASIARAPARGSVSGLARQGRTFDLRVTLATLAKNRSIPACATTACNT